jgi:hypothetical protein
VRIGAPKPKAKRFPSRHTCQKTLKITNCCPGGISFPATGLKISRAPTFAIEPNDVTGLFQQVRIDGKAAGQKAMQVAALGESMGSLAGQHRRAGWRAGGRGRKGVRKKNALSGHPIEVRRFDYLITVSAGVRPRPIIGDYHQDVRTRNGIRLGCKTADTVSRQAKE